MFISKFRNIYNFLIFFEKLNISKRNHIKMILKMHFEEEKLSFLLVSTFQF